MEGRGSLRCEFPHCFLDHSSAQSDCCASFPSVLPCCHESVLLFPFLPFSWYGWSAQARIHWIMPIIGTGIFGFGASFRYENARILCIHIFLGLMTSVYLSFCFVYKTTDVDIKSIDFQSCYTSLMRSTLLPAPARQEAWVYES